MSWDEVTNIKAMPQATTNRASGKRDQAYLIILAGGSMGEMHKLQTERVVIGRSPRCDIRVMDDGISREHCEVLMMDDRHILHDLGSTNGTFCRGQRVDNHDLADGDKILIGSGTVLKFTFHDKIDEVFQRQMFESALRDDLTKAFNKRYYLDRVDSEFSYAVRHHSPLSLVTFDIDHFKHINDTYGHPAGDLVLSELGAVVLATVRAEDVFARVGGEEFGVLCRGTDLAQGQVVGERVRAAIEKRTFIWNGQRIPVTVSVGVAGVPSGVIRDAMEFISAADQMLYEAKRGGRNRVCVYKG